MSAEQGQIFIGNVIHCTGNFKLETFSNGFVAIRDKKIIAVGDTSTLDKSKAALNLKNATEIRLKDSQILIPGLIDTHIHASQYPNVGLGMDKTLLDWLQAYTFPLESKYSDTKFAEKVYSTVVKHTLSNGTTTACYFATLHLKSSLKLVDAVIDQGQRALVGKVNMTNLSPPGLKESPEESIANTKAFVKEVLAKKNDLVCPVITPRFALSCDIELMKKLSQIAKDNNLHMQTHISETKDEVSAIKSTYNNKEYAAVYDEANVLTPKTVLAHGVHLTASELQLIASKGSSVSHCPLSNTCLQSGICDVRSLISAGISVGLGTDVSGGPSPSIVQVMRSAMEASINLSFSVPTYVPLTYQDVFFLATLGGAQALAMDNKIGNFVVGKEFDAIVVDMDVEKSGSGYLVDCNILELLQKFIYTADDRNVLQVYVAGKRVK